MKKRKKKGNNHLNKFIFHNNKIWTVDHLQERSQHEVSNLTFCYCLYNLMYNFTTLL